MFNRLPKVGPYVVLLAVAGTFVSATALILYQTAILGVVLFDIVGTRAVELSSSKALAVGLIEVVDVFLIAIGMLIISLSLYKLFVDEGVQLPSWLRVRDLDDLKAHLVSVVIAVLAVLFLREAVSWEGDRDILAFGLALASVIFALSVFLWKQGGHRD